MGIYEDWLPYIVEIVELKGVACRAKCQRYKASWTTLGLHHVDVHQSLLFWRPTRHSGHNDTSTSVDNPHIRYIVDDVDPDYKQRFRQEVVFDDWRPYVRKQHMLM